MQLLQLRIKNLNSLKGEHLIDFKSGPIGATGLFAITGPTGAGKSTILDAITLALYNQTPRSKTVSKNDIAKLGSIMTRDTDEAWAQLDFEVKNKVYRSHWGISRNRNGNLRDYSLELSLKNEVDKFVPIDVKRNEVPKENARLIGLNFDQFLRSILLSQGDFARFLKSNANERGELLEKITGTEIYRQLGRACYERRGKELKELEYLQIQLESIELLTVEERELVEKELGELTQECKVQDEKLSALRQQQQTKKDFITLNEALTKNEALRLEHVKQTIAFEPEKKKLELHEQILPLKAEVIAVQQLEKSLGDKTKEKEATKGKLHKVLEQQTAFAEDVKQIESEITKHQEKEEKMQPVIAKVRLLDSDIDLARNALTTKEKQQEELGQKMDAMQKEINLQEEKLTAHEKLISSIKTYLEEHKNIEGLGEQLPLLEQQLRVLTSGSKTFENKIVEAEKSPTQQALKVAKKNAEQLSIIQKALEQSEAFIESKQQQLSKDLPSLDVLKEHNESFRKKELALERLLDLCKNKVTQEKEIDELKKAIIIGNEYLKNDSKELREIQQALQIIQKNIEELNLRRERELLEAKYEDARQLLKPEEACPLCGSLEHPFVHEYTSRKNETESLLKLKSEQKEQLILKEKDLLEKISVLKSNEKNTRDQIDLNDKKIEESKRLINEVVSFNKLDISELKVSSLEISIAENDKQLAESAKQITVLEQLEKAIQRNKEFVMLHQELQTIIQHENELKQKLKVFGVSVSGQTFSQCIDELNNVFKLISAKKEELLQIEKSYLALTTAWQEKGKQLQELIRLFAKQNETITVDKKALEKKTIERETLLGKEKIEAIEHELISKRELYQKNRSDKQILLKESSTLCKSLTERVDELENQIVHEQKQLTTIATNLNKHLHDKGIESAEQALQMLLGDEELKLLKKKQDELLKSGTELNHAIKEQKSKLQQLSDNVDKIAYSLPELDELLKEKDQQLKIDLGKVGSLQEKIKTDTRNKAKQKERVATIEKQQKEFNRWNELSSLIGDATGNKFSRFAQELTLKQVLYLANTHLKLLSDRYLIKHVKEDNLDELFVVDIYHGNAERSVKTLSGGESFLVSLSLALGLSDLAGQNTVIGSLFIDEGFGTLDQNTLDVALSALEKLQSETNRTIGIISHVPALKERVTTQIELKKDASGYSTLQVKS